MLAVYGESYKIMDHLKAPFSGFVSYFKVVSEDKLDK